jgi:hypothetical protein
MAIGRYLGNTSYERILAHRIADFPEKIRGLLDRLMSDEHLASQVLTLCNEDRARSESKLRLNIMAEAIGFSPSNFNNWTKAGHRPDPGRIFDFVALLGITPDPHALSDLELEHSRATSRSPYPDEIYEMMERWEDQSAAARSWAAFAGSKETLARWPELSKAPRGRGTNAAEFLKIYDESLPHLKPQVFDTVHWERDTPSRIKYRFDQSRGPYVLRGDGDAASRIATSPQQHRPLALSAPVLIKVTQQSDCPAWLDPRGSQPLFDSELPTVGHSAFEIEEKAALYGGRPRAGFSALDHVVAGHAFPRETVQALEQEIRRSVSPCSSYTLRAQPGGGLSIALAELVTKLASDPVTKVFWVVGDAARTKEALSSLNHRSAEDFVAYCLGLGDQFSRAAVVIDDVSQVSYDYILRLSRFMQRCKIIAQAQNRLKLTFVFGSFGARRTCAEDRDFELTLSRADEAACYAKMARHQPAIIEDRPGGLTDIITAYPEARWYKNDAQALIDFLLEHGAPKARVMDYWLARTDFSDELERRIVERVAVAQLVGLSIPESTALQLFSWRLPRFHDAEDIAQSCKHTAVVNDDWRGVGLSCPRRAKSILARSGQFSPPFLKEVFCEIIEASLQAYQTHKPHGDEALDFARHIFQRLSKWQLFVFPGKSSIVEHLTRHFVESLSGLSGGWSADETAIWAGTLSAALPRRVHPESSIPSSSQVACADLVLRLSQHALSEVRGVSDRNSSIATSLLRAGTRLLASHLMPERAQHLAEQLMQVYPRRVILDYIQAILLENKEDRAYRANEILHAYCGLEARSVRTANLKGRYFEMSRWLGEAGRLFGKYRAALDAGNWLQRARYVWIGAGTRRVHDLNLREVFIRNAHDSIEFHPQAQGTWAPEAKRAQRLLERDRMKPIEIHGVQS